MGQTNTDIEWEKWGRKDPYFAVLTDERFRAANLSDETKDEFFDSGRQHAEHVLQVCRQYFDPSFVPRRILDFGCGVGRLVVPFAVNAQQVVGVDISLSMLEEARRNCRQRALENVVFVESDDMLSQVQGEFDLVHTCIVLQHIDPRRGVQIFSRMLTRLAPGGMGAVQITYGWRNKFPGASDVQNPAKPPHLLQKIAGRFRRRMRQVFEKPLPRKDPEMQMNPYDLNAVLSLIQHAGADRLYTEFTDHSGALGVFIFFQKRRLLG